MARKVALSWVVLALVGYVCCWCEDVSAQSVTFGKLAQPPPVYLGELDYKRIGSLESFCSSVVDLKQICAYGKCVQRCVRGNQTLKCSARVEGNRLLIRIGDGDEQECARYVEPNEVEDAECKQRNAEREKAINSGENIYPFYEVCTSVIEEPTPIWLYKAK